MVRETSERYQCARKKLILEYDCEGSEEDNWATGLIGGGPLMNWLKQREEVVWFTDGADIECDVFFNLSASRRCCVRDRERAFGHVG